MTDIVKRLEQRYHQTPEPECDLLQEAGCEIARLQRQHKHDKLANQGLAVKYADAEAEIERLQAAGDSQYVAGLKLGYNLGLDENHERLTEIIEKRIADQHE